MKTNETKVTGRNTLFIALGTVIGFLLIATVKALATGVALADCIAKTVPEAFGRAVCVALVFELFYYITKKIK